MWPAEIVSTTELLLMIFAMFTGFGWLLWVDHEGRTENPKPSKVRKD